MNDHPNKEIRAAIDYALSHGWRLIKAGPRAHVWGRLLCRQRIGKVVSSQSLALLATRKIMGRTFTVLSTAAPIRILEHLR